MMAKNAILWLISLPCATGAWAQHSAPDTLAALMVDQKLTLDGKLDEAAWQRAVKITNFTQRELAYGQPVTERTEVAVLYDDRTLYIGVWCYDREPGQIIAREMKRDFDYGKDDNVEIIFDTYHDRRNAFLFITNPNGARYDAQVLDNGQRVNPSYNGVWDVRTQRTGEGWFAEIAIPLTTLKYEEKAGQTWGFNVERNIRRKREQVMWQGWSRDAELEQVNRAGTLAGLDGLRKHRFIEMKPYAIAGVDQRSRATTTLVNAGGDVNYLVSPTLRLNLTLNTDFAQVESDRQQVNLTRFPLFFPELREFFLEGQDYFSMPFGSNIVPFYSRRIGLSPDRQTIPILAGLRLLGKVNRTTLGTMSLQTAARGDEPTSNYSVFSVRQDVFRQSTVGVLSANKITPGRLHSTTGGFFRYNTSSLFGGKNFEVQLTYTQALNSDRHTQSNSSASRVAISYPNDKMQLDAAWNRAGGSFVPETGFLRRDNFQEFYTELEFNPRPKNQAHWIRRYSFKPVDMNYYVYDSTGRLQSFFFEIRPLGFSTKSGEFFEFNVQRRGEGLIRPFAISESVVLSEGDYWWNRYEVQARSFSGRLFSVSANLNWGGFYTGRSVESSYNLIWRTSRNLNLSLTYERNWVNLAQGRFTTDLVLGRLEYALNPRLFGSFVSQWNSQDAAALVNFRLNWIPQVGKDFFLIVNQYYDATTGVRTRQTVVIAKLVWRFVL